MQTIFLFQIGSNPKAICSQHWDRACNVWECKKTSFTSLTSSEIFVSRLPPKIVHFLTQANFMDNIYFLLQLIWTELTFLSLFTSCFRCFFSSFVSSLCLTVMRGTSLSVSSVSLISLVFTALLGPSWENTPRGIPALDNFIGFT